MKFSARMIVEPGWATAAATFLLRCKAVIKKAKVLQHP